MNPEPYPISIQHATALRAPENLEKYRKKARQVRREVVLPYNRDVLWPLLCHTDLLNQQVGMKTTTNFFSAQEQGGSLMHARGKNGGFAVAYEEFPYVWNAPERYAVERVFIKGPIKYLCFQVELEAITPEETRVVCAIDVVTKLPPPLAKLVIGQEIDKFIATFKQLADRLGKGQKGLLPFFKNLPDNALRAQAEKWAEFTTDAELAKHLTHYFLCAPTRLSYRLRPREFAAWYDHDPLEVLNLCLYLVHQGDLSMQWDCRCPGCKGPKASYQRLLDLQAVSYCESCATRYGVAFDQNIELTFSPAPHVRPVNDDFFCAGSPGNTPHISWQHIVAPQTRASLQVQLAAGTYVLRSLQFEQECLLTFDADLPQKSLEMALDPKSGDLIVSDIVEGAEGASGTDVPLPCSHLSLDFDNPTDYPVLLMLEDVQWQSLAVTAAEVQCVQMFHDVFPHEELTQGLDLPLSFQVFLELRWTQADPELMDWSRHQLAQFQGAKLTEDGQHMRWIFASAFDALAAAWATQEAFQEMRDFYDAEQTLTLAIAGGSCQVSSVAGAWQYKGEAIEQLTDLSQQASVLPHHNIVVSAALFSEPGMAAFLTPDNYQVSTYRLSENGEDAVQFQWGVHDGF